MRFSVDTKVFAYLADNREPKNQAVARRLVDALLVRETWVGLQVVGELQNVFVRRFKKTSKEAAGAASFVMTAFPTFAYGREDVANAMEELRAGRLSYWDALLVSACGRHDCDVLFSEDMQDGATLNGVRLINPFRTTLPELTPAILNLLDS